MIDSMEDYTKKKSELETKKQEAIDSYNFEGRDAANADLEKLEQAKIQFENLSKTEIPEHQKDQIENLGGDLEVTKEIDQKIEDVRDSVTEQAKEIEGSAEGQEKQMSEQELRQAAEDSLEPITKDLFESLGVDPKDYMGEQVSENKEELNPELEKLEKELQEKNKIHKENYEKIVTLDEKIDQIKAQKGYPEELKKLQKEKVPSEQILAALLPDKKTGLENLRKLIASAESPHDKEKLQRLINKVDNISDQDIKDLSQNLGYSWVGISTATLAGLEEMSYREIGKILNNSDITRVVDDVNSTGQKITDLENKIKNDPDILMLLEERKTLSSQNEVNYAAVRQVENKIQELKEGGNN